MNKLKFIFSTVVVVLILFLVYNLTFNIVEPKVYDFMIRNVLTEKLPFDKHKKTYGSGDIVLIVIDEKTNEKYRWPWKRELNCKIFEYLHNYAKPKVIVHDANFASLDLEYPESDKNYFNSIKKCDNLVAGFIPRLEDWDDEKNGSNYDKKFINKFKIEAKNNQTNSPEIFRSLMKYPEPYFNVIKHTGFVTLFPGWISGNLASRFNDGIQRNYEPVINYKGRVFASLGMKAFLLANNNPEIVLSNNKINITGLQTAIPIKKTKYQSFSTIRYYKLWQGYSHPMIPAIDIMDSYDAIKHGRTPKINPKLLENKIVIIGANVPAGDGLNDNKATSMASKHPGVDIQATIIDNLISGDFLKIIPTWINVFLALAGMLMVYGFIRIYDLFKSIFTTLILVLGYFLVASMCFYFGIVINVITPVVMLLFTMIIAYTHKFVLENRSKEKVKTAMGKFMSQDVMKRVVMNIDNLGLGGKKAIVTVLFADIRGFTSMSETMSAQDVSEILNEYFTEMEPIITKYNGIINKFIGDAVMAIFGEPIQDKNHAQNAVKCAYEMLQKVKELQIKWAKEGKPKIDIGVGINTGEVFVGNIGSINRMEYTVIGDTVNIASRLESYNKIYKTRMLISSSTFEETKNILDVIKISDVEIRGKANRMDIYEVLKVY